jgi:hypothetical protein
VEKQTKKSQCQLARIFPTTVSGWQMSREMPASSENRFPSLGARRALTKLQGLPSIME